MRWRICSLAYPFRLSGPSHCSPQPSSCPRATARLDLARLLELARGPADGAGVRGRGGRRRAATPPVSDSTRLGGRARPRVRDREARRRAGRGAQRRRGARPAATPAVHRRRHGAVAGPGSTPRATSSTATRTTWASRGPSSRRRRPALRVQPRERRAGRLLDLQLAFRADVLRRARRLPRAASPPPLRGPRPRLPRRAARPDRLRARHVRAAPPAPLPAARAGWRAPALTRNEAVLFRAPPGALRPRRPHCPRGCSRS